MKQGFLTRYPYSGMAKPRMTRADSWKKRPIVLKYWDYKDSIKGWARDYKFNLGNEICVIFYIPMPKSWSNVKKVKMFGKHHQQRPDIDNLLKGLMDALLEEDSHIHTVYASKIWANEGSVDFYELPDITFL